MKIARAWSEQSTCSRLSVGCVIARRGRTLSSGFNGAPEDMPHCDHECNCGGDEHSPGYHEDDCATGPAGCVAIHAEANAIGHAARLGVALLDSTLYTTLSPCVKCAELIIIAGIRRVVWRSVYRDLAGLDLLVASEILTEQVHEELGD